MNKNKRNIMHILFLIFSLSILLNFSSDCVAADASPSGTPTVQASTIKDERKASPGSQLDGTEKTSMYNFMKMLLFGITQFFVWMISFAISLIKFSLSDAYFSLLDVKAILKGWVVVRDFLNIAFIFFLLFSAFATIFQVSRYHIKSTWVMIVVMALLVNFSWPITRIIIDVSNVTMIYILNGESGGDTTSVTSSGLLDAIGEDSGFAATIIGVSKEEMKKSFDKKSGKTNIDLDDKSYTKLLIGLVFSFLFMVTIFAIAAILIIRVIILAILLIFSSIGFVGYAFPSMNKHASSWWDNLFKYAFIGPIMLFMLFLSATLFQEIGENGKYVAEINKVVGNSTAIGTTEMQNATQSLIPIIVLWAGILAAQKLGDGASSAVIGGAKRGVAWGKNQTFGRAQRGAQYGLKQTQRGAKAAGKGALYGADNLTRIRRDENGFNMDGRSASDVVAQGHGVVDGWKKRFKNAEGDRKDKYDQTKDEYAARTEALGHGKGPVEGYGANKNAAKKHQDKQISKEMKSIKEDGASLGTMMQELEDAKGTRKTALLESLAAHKQFGKGGEDDYTKFMDILATVDDKGIKSALEGKLKGEGKGHLVAKNIATQLVADARDSGETLSQVEAEEKASVKVFGGMDGKTLAKQEMWKKKTGGNTIRTMRRVAQERIDGFQPKQQQEFRDSMTMEMSREREVAGRKLSEANARADRMTG